MKRLVSILTGLILPIFFTPCFAETREQLELPAKNSGVVLMRAYDIPTKMYYENRDTDGDGVFDFQESYTRTEMKEGDLTIIFSDNPKIIWYDKNKNQKPEDDEVFISPLENEDFMQYSKYLEERDKLFSK